MTTYKNFSFLWICFIAVYLFLAIAFYSFLAIGNPSSSLPDILPVRNRFGAVTGTVVSGETGFPLRDALVRVDGISIFTDAQGKFSLTEVVPGSHIFHYSAPAHSPQEQTDIAVRRNMTTTVPTVVLSAKAGSLAGRVVNLHTGGPMIGIEVAVGSSSTLTDGSGNFLFRLVEPGTYTITYRAPGNIQVQENMVVSEGKITSAPNVLMAVFPQVHYGSREKRKIALTVDDGFRRDYELVNLLQSYGVKATAFLVGQAAERHPEFVRHLDGLGWEIANHTYSHTNPLKQSDAQILNELQSAQRIITGITHKYSPFVRPPLGTNDARVLNAINAAGYTAAFWTLDLLDTRRDISLETQVNEVLSRARGGDILVCHFGGRNTSQALSVIVPELQKRGFEFVTLSELFK